MTPRASGTGHLRFEPASRSETKPPPASGASHLPFEPASPAAAVTPRRSLRTGEAAMLVVLVLGFTTMVTLARWIETHHPHVNRDLGDALVFMSSTAVPAAFKGLAADWYWVRTLQYLGRKLEEGTALDRASAVNPQVLAPLLELTTTLDPKFMAAYEFAAVVLPTVDVEAAIGLTRKGLAAVPDAWPLHLQHAYIHWQRGHFPAAAAAFRDGARLSSAKWMEQMAVRMDAEGGDRELARDMYRRMYEQSGDEQVKQWATKRLMQLRAFEERDQIRDVLLEVWRRRGTCADRWSDVAGDLERAGVKTDRTGAPLDPAGTPYVLALGGCAVAIDPRSAVPAR